MRLEGERRRLCAVAFLRILVLGIRHPMSVGCVAIWPSVVAVLDNLVDFVRRQFVADVVALVDYGPQSTGIVKRQTRRVAQPRCEDLSGAAVWSVADHRRKAFVS